MSGWDISVSTDIRQIPCFFFWKRRAELSYSRSTVDVVRHFEVAQGPKRNLGIEEFVRCFHPSTQSPTHTYFTLVRYDILTRARRIELNTLGRLQENCTRFSGPACTASLRVNVTIV